MAKVHEMYKCVSENVSVEPIVLHTKNKFFLKKEKSLDIIELVSQRTKNPSKQGLPDFIIPILSATSWSTEAGKAIRPSTLTLDFRSRSQQFFLSVMRP